MSMFFFMKQLALNLQSDSRTSAMAVVESVYSGLGVNYYSFGGVPGCSLQVSIQVQCALHKIFSLNRINNLLSSGSI